MSIPTDRLPGKRAYGLPGGAYMMAMTPFGPEGSPEPARLRELAQAAPQYGFAGLVVAGGAGELADLSPDEVVDLVAAAASVMDNRCVLVAGIYARPGAVSHARDLSAAGARALLVFADPDPGSDADEGLVQLVGELAQQGDLGIIVDHDPSRVSVSGLRAASERHDGLFVKWGLPDLRIWGSLRAQVPAVSGWLSGGDDLAPGFAAHGAVGFTSTASSVAPDAIAAFARLVQEGRLRDAGEWVASHLQPLATLRESRPGYVPAVTKAAMALAGRPAGAPRRAVQFDSADTEKLAAAVSALRAGAHEVSALHSGGAS